MVDSQRHRAAKTTEANVASAAHPEVSFAHSLACVRWYLTSSGPGARCSTAWPSCPNCFQSLLVLHCYKQGEQIDSVSIHTSLNVCLNSSSMEDEGERVQLRVYDLRCAAVHHSCGVMPLCLCPSRLRKHALNILRLQIRSQGLARQLSPMLLGRQVRARCACCP